MTRAANFAPLIALAIVVLQLFVALSWRVGRWTTPFERMSRNRFVQDVAQTTVLMTPEGNHIRIPSARVYKGVILNYSRNPRRRSDVSGSSFTVSAYMTAALPRDSYPRCRYTWLDVFDNGRLIRSGRRTAPRG